MQETIRPMEVNREPSRGDRRRYRLPLGGDGRVLRSSMPSTRYRSQEEGFVGIADIPNYSVNPGPTTEIARDNVAKAPAFSAWEYEEYRRSATWRIRRQDGATDGRLLAAIGMYEEGSVK